jgi:hypothetical protein
MSLLDKAKGKLAEAKDAAGALAGKAADKVNETVDELEEARKVLQSLGLSVSDVRISMGLIPEVGAKFTGSIDALDEKKLAELVEADPEQQLLLAALKALQLTCRLKEQMGDVGLKGVELDLVVSIPPKVSVRLI